MVKDNLVAIRKLNEKTYDLRLTTYDLRLYLQAYQLKDH